MKFKYRLERCSLNGVKEVSDRLTALGGQGWRVVSTSHYGAELFALMELRMEQNPPQKDAMKKGPGRPKKIEPVTTSSSIGPVEITVN